MWLIIEPSTFTCIYTRRISVGDNQFLFIQVAPAELEDCLLKHESVLDCAVVPLPNEDVGEIPKAYVVLKPNAAKVESDDLIQYVAGQVMNETDFIYSVIKIPDLYQVASYKKIRALEFIDAIPKSASGKILRRILKEKAIVTERRK